MASLLGHRGILGARQRDVPRNMRKTYRMGEHEAVVHSIGHRPSWRGRRGKDLSGQRKKVSNPSIHKVRGRQGGTVNKVTTSPDNNVTVIDLIDRGEGTNAVAKRDQTAGQKTGDHLRHTDRYNEM
ncbi:hypothetical protein Btru_058891 [Bulinus truncatus]|nr:hypothetical protein Btru_058891 [Bulinus truncatus]